MEYFREHEMLDAAVDGRMTFWPPDGTAGESTSIKKHPQRSAHGPRQPGSAAADAFLPAAVSLRTGPLTQAGARDIIGSTKKNYDN